MFVHVGVRYTEAEARAAIASSRSFSEALRKLGMRAAGGNHRTLRKYAKRIWHIPTDTAPTKFVTPADGWDSNLNIASFAQDTDGELFLVDVRTSGIYKLIAGN